MLVLTEPRAQKPVLSVASAEGLGRAPAISMGSPSARAGAVGLDVGDRVRVDPGHRLRHGDGLRLPVHARRGEAHLAGAVVVDGGALDDRVDRVAVGERFVQPLQHHDRRAPLEKTVPAARSSKARQCPSGEVMNPSW